MELVKLINFKGLDLSSLDTDKKEAADDIDISDKVLRAMKTKGVDLGVDFTQTKVGRGLLKSKTNLLNYTLAIMASSLFIRKLVGDKDLLLDDNHWSVVKHDITLNQYRMMLFYYYKHTKKSVSGDLMLHFSEYSSDAVNLRSNTIVKFKDLLHEVERCVKKMNEKISSGAKLTEIESQFVKIHNECCDTLEMPNKKMKINTNSKKQTAI